jgi:hypothetical protein
LDALQASGIVGVRLNLIGQAVPDVTSSPWKELVAECGWLSGGLKGLVVRYGKRDR